MIRTVLKKPIEDCLKTYIAGFLIIGSLNNGKIARAVVSFGLGVILEKITLLKILIDILKDLIL
ncbi:hypothetical protein N7488_012320 [Penicillium malachiteum]|nr:hypothetical protein N7488_012320 [Penicillium malachiteum]